LTDYTITVVKDALIVLGLVGESKRGITLTEITSRTGLVKNKVFRILHTLQEERMVYRDENSRFHLGLRIVELAENVHSHDVLLTIANPVMDQLVEDTQESIFLGVVLDTNALCIAARESPQSMRLFAQVGIQSPLFKGGVPKVLLANMNRQERENHLVNFAKDHTSVDWDALRERLAKIREQGYSITIDELDDGAHSITAPIFNANGKILAAMSIAGPSVRFSDTTIERYIELILKSTSHVSSELGYKTKDYEESIKELLI